MSNNYLVLGQWNVICDVCGKRYKIGEMKKRWDGLLVCERDFEQDHPQKYLRVRETGQSVPIIRDEPTDVFQFSCDFIGVQPLSDWAVAGCATVGVISPLTMHYGVSGVSGYAMSGVAITAFWSPIPGTVCLEGPEALPNFGFPDCMIAEAP